MTTTEEEKFYQTLKDNRPQRISDLWETVEGTTRGNGEGKVVPLCLLAQNLNLWATNDEIADLLLPLHPTKDSALNSNLKNLVTCSQQAIVGLIQNYELICKSAKDPKAKHKVFISTCQGCNSLVHCSDVNNQKNCLVLSQDDECQKQFVQNLHTVICTLSVMHHVLARQLSSNDCRLLVDLMVENTDGSNEDQNSFLFLLGKLLKIRSLPKVGVIVSSVLSLWLTRHHGSSGTPDTTTPNFAATSLAEEFLIISITRCEYVFHAMMKRNSQPWERIWAIVEYNNLLPALYFLGFSGKNVFHLKNDDDNKYMELLAGLMATLCIMLAQTIRKNTIKDQEKEWKKSRNENQTECLFVWDPLLQARNKSDSSSSPPEGMDFFWDLASLSSTAAPQMYAVFATMEVLLHWEKKAADCNEQFLKKVKVITRQMDYIPIAEYFTDHKNNGLQSRSITCMVQMIQHSEGLGAYGRSLWNHLANGTVPDENQDQGIFCAPLSIPQPK